MLAPLLPWSGAWESYLRFGGLSLIICQMGMIMVPSSCSIWRTQKKKKKPVRYLVQIPAQRECSVCSIWESPGLPGEHSPALPSLSPGETPPWVIYSSHGMKSWTRASVASTWRMWQQACHSCISCHLSGETHGIIFMCRPQRPKGAAWFIREMQFSVSIPEPPKHNMVSWDSTSIWEEITIPFYQWAN